MSGKHYQNTMVPATRLTESVGTKMTSAGKETTLAVCSRVTCGKAPPPRAKRPLRLSTNLRMRVHPSHD